MSWEDTIRKEDSFYKGKRMDSLVHWWKNRKFKNAARSFLKSQVGFAMKGDYGDYSYIHKPEKVEEDKEAFLKIMGEIFEEEYSKMGKRAASDLNWDASSGPDW